VENPKKCLGYLCAGSRKQENNKEKLRARHCEKLEITQIGFNLEMLLREREFFRFLMKRTGRGSK